MRTAVGFAVRNTFFFCLWTVIEEAAESSAEAAERTGVEAPENGAGDTEATGGGGDQAARSRETRSHHREGSPRGRTRWDFTYMQNRFPSCQSSQSGSEKNQISCPGQWASVPKQRRHLLEGCYVWGQIYALVQWGFPKSIQYPRNAKTDITTPWLTCQKTKRKSESNWFGLVWGCLFW